jgi:uncharacterized membrane protein
MEDIMESNRDHYVEAMVRMYKRRDIISCRDMGIIDNDECLRLIDEFERKEKNHSSNESVT